MYIDFAINNTEINEVETKNIISEIIKYPVNSITVPHYLLKSVKGMVNIEKIALSCLIDYPLGISDSKTRRSGVEQAQKSGATAIDISMPQNLAANRKYDKIREDIKNILDFCNEHSVHIRYILEYRVFDHHCLKKICEIFDDFNINHVYPSTGYFIDNLADNILASIFLYQNSKNLNVLSTGNIWTEKHFETIKKSGLYGFRTNSIHSLRNFIEFNSVSKNNGV
jgi:deoxyribose-phosphate aldolase